jgi:hypothetical protein
MEGRDSKGRFAEGNPSNPGNDFALKYKEEYVDLCRDFLSKCEAEDAYPAKSKFARMVGVHACTLDEWAAKYPRFQSIMVDFEDLQKEILVKNGLIEKYNPGFTRFLLSANHGMKEKTESDVNVNGKADVGVRIEVVDKVEKK